MSLVSLKNILKASVALVLVDPKKITQQQKSILKIFLKKVYYTDNLEQAQSLYTLKSPDIIISDLQVKEEDCIEFLFDVREYNQKIPIIVFSQNITKEILMRLIPLGVVEVLEKPISSDKLIHTLNKTSKYILNFGTKIVEIDSKVKYDYSSKTVLMNKSSIPLTKNESQLLELFLSHHGKVFTKQAIEFHIWGESMVSDGAFKSLIKRMRDKIGKEYILNNSGHGYYLLKN
jgi:DNA-binding response OmpR family regulator